MPENFEKEDIKKKGEQPIRKAAEEESPAYQTEWSEEPRRADEEYEEGERAPLAEGLPEHP
ncbi:MAG: hypothetical protein WBV82_21350 [Myxococcaceae bacterium]